MDTEVSEAPVVSFRPVKRQKHMRKRADESDDVPLSENAQRPISEERHIAAQESQESDDEGGSSKIRRPRKPNRMRKGGIEFSTNSSQFADKSNNMALDVQATETDVLKAKLDRFTAHSGQTVDVDRHMYVVLLLFKISHDILHDRD